MTTTRCFGLALLLILSFGLFGMHGPPFTQPSQDSMILKSQTHQAFADVLFGKAITVAPAPLADPKSAWRYAAPVHTYCAADRAMSFRFPRPRDRL